MMSIRPGALYVLIGEFCNAAVRYSISMMVVRECWISRRPIPLKA